MTPGYAAPLTAVDSCERVPGGVRARLAIRSDEEALAGHFPGLPIFPGVFILESVLQALSTAYERPVRLRELRSVRFLAPLLPGDELTLDISVEDRVARATGRRADGGTAAELTALVDG